MKHLIIIIISILLFSSCSKDDSFSVLDQSFTSRSKSQTFKVRIESIDEGSFSTPFAPGVWIVQKKKSAPIFTEGSPDYGDGLEALAEDGSPGMLNNAMDNHPKVRSNGIFNTPVGAAGPGPIFPGDAYEFEFSAKPKDLLNFATMFIESNDLFVGPESGGLSLFDSHGNPLEGDITDELYLWDAGTEINEEPGVGPNQAPRQSGPNTGPDENGTVQLVNDGYEYPAVNEILRVTVTVL